MSQKIYRPPDQSFERFEQAEIPIRIATYVRFLEFHQKIEVAARGIEAAGRGRAEQVEPAHVEPAAQRPQCRQVRVDDFGTTGDGC